MSEKAKFEKACLEMGLEASKLNAAWKAYSLLKEAVKTNWSGHVQLGQTSEVERLEIRNAMAEQGVEVTPQELDTIVKLSTTIQAIIMGKKNDQK